MVKFPRIQTIQRRMIRTEGGIAEDTKPNKSQTEMTQQLLALKKERVVICRRAFGKLMIISPGNLSFWAKCLKVKQMR